MLEELGEIEVFSIFVFGYNSAFDCFVAYFIDENWDEYKKYEEVQKFNKSFNLFVENFKKAEEARKAIFEYFETPQNYYSYDKTTGQLTHKKTSEISSKFDDFITAIYRTYQTFFEFIDRFDVDKNDLHKEYINEKISKKDDLYKYLFQNEDNRKFFESHFDDITEIWADIKERRNYGIDHNFSKRKLELQGKLTYAIDKDGNYLGLNSPKTDFKGKEVNVFEYVDYVYNALIMHFQHILVMYSNNILERQYAANKTQSPELRSGFHSIKHLKDLYKNEGLDFPTHLESFHKKQAYIFGVFMQGQFVTMKCNGLINPAIRYKDHLEMNVSEPYYSQIKSGQKIIEGRMSSKRFREIKKGDRILINKKLPAFVDEVMNFASFEDMFNHYGLENCLPSVSSLKEGLDIYEKFYSKDDIRKHGVIAIKLLVQNY